MAQCTVYRSDKKADTYLYLAQRLQLSDLPETLLQTFGDAVEVMNLDLQPHRPLARVDTESVINALEDQGFYIQFPPKLPIEEEITARFNR